MRTRRLARSLTTCLFIFAAAAWPRAASSAPTTSVIFSFEEEDGEYPSTDLVLDGAGNLYGTAVQGGEFGGGTVFRLSPTDSGWIYTVLYDFTGQADGGQPYGGVTLDSNGNLYGTCVIGGTGGICAEDGCGVAYKLTNVAGHWVQTILHHFTGGEDGSGPGAALSIDADGNLYGMTPTGGDYGLGTIYKLHPMPGGGWKFGVLHAFTGGDDGGAASAGRLLLDGSGYIYGVATIGGANGKGVVFRLTTTGTDYTTLYAFGGQPDAGFPYGGLISDAVGNLYGTTYYDGANNLGCVYQLTNTNGVWNETVLYSFQGGTDGANPIGNVVLDARGNLFGTTSEGGAPGCGCGTIFRVARRNGVWVESIVHRFENTPDGAFPYNGMVADRRGTLYGATVHGGDDGDGSIFRFSLFGASDVVKGEPLAVLDAVVGPAEGATLLGASPNPFRDAGVAVRYALPAEGRVRVSVYGMDGRLVRVVSDGVEPAGTHEAVWNGLTDQGAVAGRGIYVCEVEFAGTRQRVRLTSLR